ncbi:MAG TPA: hypothetical protein VHN13_16245 [Candidatus Tectomicrobia bacterium]|nr:hypothetical protein [Candidatus Tectomicrobia bacterium]
MPGKSITVDLPDDLYERVQQVAAQSQRPVERVVLESLRLLFVPPPSPADLATSLAALPSYSDAQLWAMVYQRLAWPQSQRLHELSAKNKLERLTKEEQLELEDLLSSNDQAMLLRSEALRLLKNRGYNIEAYLKRGA